MVVVVLAVAHPWESASSYLSSQSLANLGLAAHGHSRKIRAILFLCIVLFQEKRELFCLNSFKKVLQLRLCRLFLWSLRPEF